MKKDITTFDPDTALLRQARLDALMGKYFDLFCASFEYEGISRDKFRKIMAALWMRGTLIAVKANGAEAIEEALGELDNALMGICDYNPISWNIDGSPLDLTCQLSSIGIIGSLPVTNEMSMQAESQLLPLGEKLTNGKTCVVGYALQSHQPLATYVYQLVNSIVDAEMTIRNNQIAIGLQTFIVTSKDSMIRAKNLIAQIMEGSPIKVVSSKTAESIAFPALGISDHCDGQFKLKINFENELKTYLGIRNIGNIEKKERVNTEEAASNNEETDIGGDGIEYMIDSFCKDCGEVLGFDFAIRRRKPAERAEENPEDGETEEDEDAVD